MPAYGLSHDHGPTREWGPCPIRNRNDASFGGSLQLFMGRVTTARLPVNSSTMNSLGELNGNFTVWLTVVGLPVSA
ncbi:unnamed protein product [Linum trigynum]|uniref:Uncharacterized protein n=1 Tax=Linum trigynum TaxID=586398 RepID=A0AAV2EDV7_9ROSI